MSEPNKNISNNETRPLVAEVPDVSEEVHFIFDVALNCFLIHLMCLFGILGNSLTVLIMTKNGYNNPTDIALTGLAVSDLFYSVTQSLLQVSSIISRFDIYDAYTYFAYFYLYVYYWNQTCMLISIELVTIIAIERMLAVWFPFHVSRILSPLRMRCLVVFVFFALSAFILPLMAFMQYGETTIDATNRTVVVALYTDYYINNVDYINNYRNYFLLFVTAIFPFLAITLCSVLIILKLILSNRKFTKLGKTTMRKRVKDLRSIKVTLLICCSLMVLVIVPVNTLDIYYTMGQTFPFGVRIYSIILYFLQIITQFNASSNFIIYVTGNATFLKTFRKLSGICY